MALKGDGKLKGKTCIIIRVSTVITIIIIIIIYISLLLLPLHSMKYGTIIKGATVLLWGNQEVTTTTTAMTTRDWAS